MNIWSLLGRWADKRKPAVTVTLLSGDAAPAGLMAVAEVAEGNFVGPLIETAFWAEDLASFGEKLLALPETGRQIERSGRRYYVSPLSYRRTALVLGGGHVGGALSRLLCFLDFDVTLMDDRPEFLTGRDDVAVVADASFEELSKRFSAAGLDAVVIVTRGHAQDTICLRQVLSWPLMPSYLGMIGSRHRTTETLKMLTSEGFKLELLSRVHTPVGLKIGAQTPAEISVSIAAEIIQVLNKK